MYGPHRPLEQSPKRKEKEKQRESQPHPDERENQELKQEWQPVENTDHLYDVSDDETNHPNTNNPKAKAKSKSSGADAEEKSRILRPKRSILNFGLTGGNSSPRVVNDMDKREEAKSPGEKFTPIMNLFRRKKVTNSAKPASGLAHILPPPPPKDIPGYRHSLQQNTIMNAKGDILLYAAPTGSTAARDIVPLALKVKHLSMIGKPEEEITEAPICDKKCLSTDTEHPKRKGKQYASFNSLPKSREPEYFPPAPEEKPTTFFRAKITVAPCQDNTLPQPSRSRQDSIRLQPLSIERGEILEFKCRVFTDNTMDQPKYVLQRRRDPDVFGWVFVHDVEPIDDSALLRRGKRARERRKDV